MTQPHWIKPLPVLRLSSCSRTIGPPLPLGDFEVDRDEAGPRTPTPIRIARRHLHLCAADNLAARDNDLGPRLLPFNGSAMLLRRAVLRLNRIDLCSQLRAHSQPPYLASAHATATVSPTSAARAITTAALRITCPAPSEPSPVPFAGLRRPYGPDGSRRGAPSAYCCAQVPADQLCKSRDANALDRRAAALSPGLDLAHLHPSTAAAQAALVSDAGPQEPSRCLYELASSSLLHR